MSPAFTARVQGPLDANPSQRLLDPLIASGIVVEIPSWNSEGRSRGCTFSPTARVQTIRANGTLDHERQSSRTKLGLGVLWLICAFGLH